MNGHGKRVVVLVSGRGSNLEAIHRASLARGWGGHVAAVVSNRAEAGGLAYAASHGIATAVVDHRAHATREAFDAALATAIDAHAPDVVALAGFMRILGDDFVRRYAGRMVNIHPSLLPAFAGLRTHRRALEAGCKLHGATVHLVTPTLDHGPILAQSAVPVLPGDTEASLSARVLQREHIVYPLAIGWLLRDELIVGADGVVTHRRGESQLLMT